MERRLYRSNTQKIFGGVCGGIGEYFDVDPVLVRIIAVILAFGPGVGVLAYIIAWIIMPERPGDVIPVESTSRPASWHKYLPGLILMGIGVLLLVRDFWFWFGWDELWPIVLIGIGVALIMRSGRKKQSSDDVPPEKTEASPFNGGSEL